MFNLVLILSFFSDSVGFWNMVTEFEGTCVSSYKMFNSFDMGDHLDIQASFAPYCKKCVVKCFFFHL